MQGILNCGNIFLGKTSVFAEHTQRKDRMKEEDKYYIVKKKAVPEVLLKVVEAKRMIEMQKAETIQEAADAVGISRSSFYKYKEDIFPFQDHVRGKNITFILQMEDQPGLLSNVLKKVADYGANILTIHQTIPVNGVALITLSVEILPSTDSVSVLVDNIEALNGIHKLKILARE